MIIKHFLIKLYSFAAQVNMHMPRTFGDALIHISHIDMVVEHDSPLTEYGSGKTVSPEQMKIGKFIGQNLVEDGATLQMGT